MTWLLRDMLRSGESCDAARENGDFRLRLRAQDGLPDVQMAGACEREKLHNSNDS
jgi:hypothetical protein